MSNHTKCKSCNALFTWLPTKSKKMMPVDLTDQLILKFDSLNPPTEFDHKTMVSHFATCPGASQHRKRGA